MNIHPALYTKGSLQHRIYKHDRLPPLTPVLSLRPAACQSEMYDTALWRHHAQSLYNCILRALEIMTDHFRAEG